MVTVKFEYDSTNNEDHRKMGGYTFPILDSLPCPYVVRIYNTPKTQEELLELAALVRSPDCILSYVDGNKFVSVWAEAGLSALGLKIWTSDVNSKTIKRAKTLARPFRVHSEWDELRIMVIPGGKELDGAGIVSPDVYFESVANVQLGYWNPAQRATIMRWLDRQRIHNCRFVGKLIDSETGLPLGKFGKGNFIVAPTPVGVDIITTEDNLKHEVTGDGPAWALFEPQGSKDAWEDQQTFVNQRFILSLPEAKERMRDNAEQALQDLTEGRLMSSTVELARAEFHKDFAWDDDRFWKELKWNTNAWALHGLSYTLSPWLTERLGSSWISSLAVDDPRKIRIKIPCAIRAQVVSNSLVKLAGVDMVVEEGDMRWCPELRVLVSNDRDWEETIIPSHGGCDLDDFFVGRYREIDGVRKIVITRSPNARGEYSVWNYVPGDWNPKHINAKGEEVTFPPIRLKRWPKQILQAIADGDVSYIDLPSTGDGPGETRQYVRKDVLEDLQKTMLITGGYGQYELAVRAYNSLSPTKMDPIQIRSEDAVDAFTQGGTVDQRAFILEDRKRILRALLFSGKKVDVVLGSRLGVRELPLTYDGPVSHVKTVMEKEVDRYRTKMHEFASKLPTPEFLEELGRNEMSPYATQVLKASRRAMYWADQATEGLDHEDRVLAIREAQEEVILNFFNEVQDQAIRAQYALAFWRACRITPTTGGKMTDQPCFGTGFFQYLLDALVFYGIAEKPYVDDRGRLLRRKQVKYLGNQNWDATCKSCDGHFEVGFTGIVRFWALNATCKTCREAA